MVEIKIALKRDYFGLTSDVGPTTIHDGRGLFCCDLGNLSSLMTGFRCPGLALLYFVGLVVLEDTTCTRAPQGSGNVCQDCPERVVAAFLSHVPVKE